MAESGTQQGGCLCGAVRYELAQSDVVSAHHCYCRDCQRSTGGGFTTFFMLPDASFTLLQGKLASCRVTGESGGTIERSFCPDCGSPIFSQASIASGLVFVKAGSLDHGDWLQITSSFWGSSAQPWTVIDERHEIHDRNPG